MLAMGSWRAQWSWVSLCWLSNSEPIRPWADHRYLLPSAYKINIHLPRANEHFVSPVTRSKNRISPSLECGVCGVKKLAGARYGPQVGVWSRPDAPKNNSNYHTRNTVTVCKVACILNYYVGWRPRPKITVPQLPLKA